MRNEFAHCPSVTLNNSWELFISVWFLVLIKIWLTFCEREFNFISDKIQYDKAKSINFCKVNFEFAINIWRIIKGFMSKLLKRVENTIAWWWNDCNCLDECENEENLYINKKGWKFEGENGSRMEIWEKIWSERAKEIKKNMKECMIEWSYSIK